MLRIHIPLENPSLGAQGGAQPPKFHKNSAAPPPSPTLRAFPGASRGIRLHPTDPLRARGGLRQPRSRAWQLPWQPYIFLRIPNDSLAPAPIHGFFWDAGGSSPCSAGLDPLDPRLKSLDLLFSRLFFTAGASLLFALSCGQRFQAWNFSGRGSWDRAEPLAAPCQRDLVSLWNSRGIPAMERQLRDPGIHGAGSAPPGESRTLQTRLGCDSMGSGWVRSLQAFMASKEAGMLQGKNRESLPRDWERL